MPVAITDTVDFQSLSVAFFQQQFANVNSSLERKSKQGALLN